MLVATIMTNVGRRLLLFEFSDQFPDPIAISTCLGQRCHEVSGILNLAREKHWPCLLIPSKADRITKGISSQEDNFSIGVISALNGLATKVIKKVYKYLPECVPDKLNSMRVIFLFGEWITPLAI